MHVSGNRKQSRTEEDWRHGVDVWAKKQRHAPPHLVCIWHKASALHCVALSHTNCSIKGSITTAIRLNSPDLFIDGSKGFLNFSHSYIRSFYKMTAFSTALWVHCLHSPEPPPPTKATSVFPMSPSNSVFTHRDADWLHFCWHRPSQLGCCPSPACPGCWPYSCLPVTEICLGIPQYYPDLAPFTDAGAGTEHRTGQYLPACWGLPFPQPIFTKDPLTSEPRCCKAIFPTSVVASQHQSPIESQRRLEKCDFSTLTICLYPLL